MKKSHIILIAAGAAVFFLAITTSIAIAGIANFNAVNQARERAQNQDYAAIIAEAFNTNNFMKDNENKLTRVPETLEEFNLWADAALSMDETNYSAALTYIDYNESGEAFVEK